MIRNVTQPNPLILFQFARHFFVRPPVNKCLVFLSEHFSTEHLLFDFFQWKMNAWRVFVRFPLWPISRWDDISERAPQPLAAFIKGTSRLPFGAVRSTRIQSIQDAVISDHGNLLDEDWSMPCQWNQWLFNVFISDESSHVSCWANYFDWMFRLDRRERHFSNSLIKSNLLEYVLCYFLLSYFFLGKCLWFAVIG